MHASSNHSLWFGCLKRMELQGRRLPVTVHCLHCLCTSPLLPLLWVSGHAPESFWEWSVGHLWGPPIHQGWRHLAKDDLNEAAGELWQHRCMLFEQFHTLQLDLWTDSRYSSHSHYSLSDHSASFVFKRDEKSECYLDDMLVQFPAVPFLPFPCDICDTLWHARWLASDCRTCMICPHTSCTRIRPSQRSGAEERCTTRPMPDPTPSLPVSSGSWCT